MGRYKAGSGLDQYEFFDDDFIAERRRRTRRLQVVAAIVALALLALTVLSTVFDVINLPSSPPTTEPIFVALAGLR
jgi:hypothetical protein